MITANKNLSPHARFCKREGGITYLVLLVAIAIIGIAAVATTQFGVIVQRRDAEEQLLTIGAEFQAALISYANATPPGLSPNPSSIQDLLKDPRYPTVLRRHLRKLYSDPLTGKSEWGTVASIDGRGIVGFYSLSAAEPIKIGNFEPPFESFAGKSTYRDWVFAVPTTTSSNYISHI
jgi:type II secretory pathway pseudopilin PulG